MYPMERFNNWIKSRILNRRYPESTVIETYRLYEMGFYLQVTKQLPTGATIDIGTYTSECEQNGVDENLHNGYRGCGYQTILDPSHVSDLNRLYMHTYREYRNAVIEYEKGTAEKRDGQPWSYELQDGPYSSKACTITQFKVCTIKDCHGRSITYGSLLSEHVNSVHVSSYVHLKTSPDIFGRIKFIFSTAKCMH